MSGRRFTLYFSWSRPAETGASLGQLDNRFPALFEFRRAIWPLYEWASDPDKYAQGVSGFLDHVILFDFTAFIDTVSTMTGNSVRIVQREADASPARALDTALMQETDTLIVVSLDHLRTGQRPAAEEVEAVKAFLRRAGSCLIVCPHHDVGADGDQASQLIELDHHGDRLVPHQQRLGGFARTLLGELGFPIENRYGLRPAADGRSPAPLEVRRDLDELGLLKQVETFNLHPHLPHLWIPPELRNRVRILARQPLDPRAGEHPFVAAGNRAFDALLWIPPDDDRAGHIVVCDATLWSAAFGGVPGLRYLWRNLSSMR